MHALLPELSSSIEIAALVHHHRSHFLSSFEMSRKVAVHRVGTLGSFLFTPVSPTYPFHLKRILSRFQPDLIHVHTPNPWALLLLVFPACNQIPIVIHWHADIVLTKHHSKLSLAYRAYRPLEQRLLKKASAIIATSPPYLDSSEPLRAWRKKCKVVPLGLKPPTTASCKGDEKAGHWRTSAAFKILCIGRLTYYKGHEYLIRAVAKLREVELIIVGIGEQQRKLHDFIQNLDDAPPISLFGEASDDQICALLKSCDCLCLPSIERTEAFGLVLLEAMREGKPSVVTDVPGSGMSWVIQDEVTGLVAKWGDVESLRDQLKRLQNDPNLRESLGAAARMRFDEDFTISSVTRKVIDLYEQVLSQRQGGTEITEL